MKEDVSREVISVDLIARPDCAEKMDRVATSSLSDAKCRLCVLLVHSFVVISKSTSL